ncbi:MAG: hypothetical protein WD928_13595 [Gammaproteobacteria bacterium]
MGEPARISIARQLAPRGLLRTLILAPGGNSHTVSRIKIGEDGVALTPLGQLPTTALPIIGRVGLPDPQLGPDWAQTMPFYGKWFDDIGETDIGYRLRRNISALSSDRLLEQIQRDDNYALVAEFTAAFQTIMVVKERVPLVLIDDRHLALASFPVVLPSIEDSALASRLMGILRIMLKAEAQAAERPAGGPDGIDGIEVEEMDGE